MDLIAEAGNNFKMALDLQVFQEFSTYCEGSRDKWSSDKRSCIASTDSDTTN